MVSNNSAFIDICSKISDDYDKLYIWRAFLHWCQREDM